MLRMIRWGLGILLLGQMALAQAESEAVAPGTGAGTEAAAPVVDSQGWWIVRDDKRRDIRAWARQEDGKRLRSFKVEGSIAGKSEDLMMVLLDFENYKKWFWSVRDTKLLKRVSPTEYYVYITHKAPYPLADRDTVLHAKVKPQSKTDKRVVLTVSAAPDYMPEQENLVRMVAEEFTVVFTPRPNGKIDVQVSGYFDPGGKAIPAWAINFVQRSAPYHTVRGLQRMTEKPELIENRSTLPFPVYDFDALGQIATL